MADPVKGAGAGSYRRFFVFTIVTAFVVAAVTFGVTALLINIFERQQEARNPFFRVVEITDDIDDAQVWGKNFPLQYDQYLRTVDMERTRYGGSEAVPRTPTEADPRSVVARSMLEEDPRLTTIWDGYSFAVDFREARGHAYMLEDQTHTERQRVTQQQGNCLHCHASVYTAYKELGDGDIVQGFHALNPMVYEEARQHVEHPISCIDCHDPETMQLRVTRPAFMEGIRTIKQLEGIEDYDVNRDATHQQMRSFVCGQCHVEYYFKGPEGTLTYSWGSGIKADEILEYFDAIGFHDWRHVVTDAPMIKAQHPEFEMWNQGIHARAGVSCADCHMPYMRVGAQKISDHHVRSPLLNIANACQTCHRVPEEELLARAEAIQDKTFELRNHAMTAVVELIRDIQVLREQEEVSPEHLAQIQDYHRKSQFLLDFIEQENSTGFHAPQEAARVLGLSINYARKGQIAVREAALGRPFEPLPTSPADVIDAVEAAERADPAADTEAVPAPPAAPEDVPGYPDAGVE